MTRILVYTGKGGVGKTSVAAATAIACADRGYRTIVMSTDIAHSLSDAFDIPIGPTATEIASEWTPVASSTRPAQAATTTLLTTATIPAAVSVSRHALGESLSPSSGPAEGGPETATRYGSSSGETRR